MTYILPLNVETLSLMAGSSAVEGYGNSQNNVINGNENDNILGGGDGEDRLRGYAGNDELYGDSGDDTLEGGFGNDYLHGGAGIDTMWGGIGNDNYVVDQESDSITEFSGEGFDVVHSYAASYALSAEVEDLTLHGSALHGTGNGLDNTIQGNGNGNILGGSSGNDTLYGYGGNDWLTGGTGNDVMRGGIGDDTYVVDSIGDDVIEVAGEGEDTVFSSVSYTLGANEENLAFMGGGALNGTGNNLDNEILGNSWNNILTGNGGDDTLDGSGGNDTMSGGTGNDWYYVGETGDAVIENAGAGLRQGLFHASITCSAPMSKT